jgi:hypothetical protein
MNRSESINELAAALAKAKLSFAPIVKNRTNTYLDSKYADQESINSAITPSLSSTGIVLMHFVERSELTGFFDMIALLAHSSGQWIESRMTFPAGKGDAQSFGSSMTYCMRYSTRNILGLASEDDDDGERNTEKAESQNGTTVAEKKENPVDITAKKVRDLGSLARSVGIKLNPDKTTPPIYGEFTAFLNDNGFVPVKGIGMYQQIVEQGLYEKAEEWLMKRSAR